MGDIYGRNESSGLLYCSITLTVEQRVKLKRYFNICFTNFPMCFQLDKQKYRCERAAYPFVLLFGGWLLRLEY